MRQRLEYQVSAGGRALALGASSPATARSSEATGSGARVRTNSYHTKNYNDIDCCSFKVN